MAYISAFGASLPPRVVRNAELAERLGCDEEWIVRSSGIRERRWAAEGERVADLGAEAASDCISRSGNERPGLLLVASGSAERRFPGPAAEIAAKLGFEGLPAVDLPIASAGSVFGLALAAKLCEQWAPVLVVAAEKMSAVINREPLDRNTAILFGDGAGACLISPERGAARIIDSALHSDGSFADALRLETNGSLSMDGRTVILQASRKLPAVIREVLDRNRIDPSQVNQYLIHQANQNLTERVASSLWADPARFYSNIERYGNTSSASMLIAAAEWAAGGGFTTGAPVVFAGFGAGFHWGAVLAMGS